MPKNKTLSVRTSPEAFQTALDAMDVIGRWEWDATTDLARVDAFVALVFNVDPEDAKSGLPLSCFIDSIHADDRERVRALINRSTRDGSPFLAEYRVISVDGRTRWVLDRGRFTTDRVGRRWKGAGILVDITQMRMTEDTCRGFGVENEDSALDRAAEHAIAAQQAIVEMQDPRLKGCADALLLELGRRLAQKDIRSRRGRMN
ncbi:PAS domain-containing protein [Methylobacterium sp. E-025]|uniref:PAS domain-containing protein n=1 Tax=Methylobacterium sp. E-025 TaxID=2836561 RepID=UPI001FBBC70E|nr:PAS domain-containing protein [Methylobacterium sp. E-025]MCJ2114994.1 PAS domain-containing protein [Methylobacterium sp. E-025]